MMFRATDDHIHEYHTQGFTVFQEIVPTSLLSDLRREADRGRAIARETHGPQAQRLQPISKYDLDLRPFEEFARLPEIVQALQTVLTLRHCYGKGPENPLGGTGILFEPRDRPWCTAWHRDWRDNVRGLDITVWQERQLEIDLFNQVNCALYEDSSLWVVPGSHLRRDLPAEARRFPDRPIPGPNLEGAATPEELERRCLDYARSLPGAFQAHLNPGDFMLYRNSLWHLGNYVPWHKRATIHDFITTPEYTTWMSAPPMRPDGVAEWMNPNG